jgi:hypothetical protein
LQEFVNGSDETLVDACEKAGLIKEKIYPKMNA